MTKISDKAKELLINYIAAHEYYIDCAPKNKTNSLSKRDKKTAAICLRWASRAEFAKLIDYISDLEEENAQLKESRRWRDVSIESPEKGVYAIVSNGSRGSDGPLRVTDMDFLEYEADGMWIAWDGDCFYYQYWQPQPDLPKEKNEQP